MRLDGGETWNEKKSRLAKWHRHFCWFPAQLGLHDYRWLEYVERCGQYTCSQGYWRWEWEYREIRG